MPTDEYREEHPFSIDDEMIDNILVAAFEGGINYWCAKADAHEGAWPESATYASDLPSRGGTVVLTYLEPEDAEDDGIDGPVLLDKAKIVRGIREAAKLKEQTPFAWYEDHDAGDADAAVQFAVFGKLIYG